MADPQTYAEVNFLLWLKEQLEQRRQAREAKTAKPPAARAPPERKLCLLVLASAALTNAWVNTLNNDAIMACRAADEKERESDAEFRDTGEWSHTLGDHIVLADDENEECNTRSILPRRNVFLQNRSPLRKAIEKKDRWEDIPSREIDLATTALQSQTSEASFPRNVQNSDERLHSRAFRRRRGTEMETGAGFSTLAPCTNWFSCICR